MQWYYNFTMTFEREQAERKIAELDALLTVNWRAAREQQDRLRKHALEIAGYVSMDGALKAIGPRTAIVFIAAGAGTRWDASFQGRNQIYEPSKYDISRGRSRAMARVPNVLPRDVFPDDTIPVIGYNLWASRNIPGARRCVISRGEDQEELHDLAAKLGISIECRQQQPMRNKVRGHGDAIAQNLDVIADSDYTLTQFCGDASSPKTIHDTLLAFDAMQKVGKDVNVLMATTPDQAASSQLAIDDAGFVRRFNHPQLFKKDIVADDQNLRMSGSNSSIYVFKSQRLAQEANAIAQAQNEAGTYAFLPFHPEESDEFAIDDVILLAAEHGTVRQLCIASPEETRTTKDLTMLPGLIDTMKNILRQNDIEPEAR
jgi:hypothetical protein